MAPRASGFDNLAHMRTLKVVAALDAAEEGSEYLDYAIQQHFGLMKPAPPYTRSLDAAMTIVPDGWSMHRLCRRHDGLGQVSGWFAELYRDTEASIEVPSNSMGATAPRAICRAAMRIHEAQTVPAQGVEATEKSGKPGSSRRI
jgi:hypothetical protein